MENVEIEFTVLRWMDYNDRFYVAKCGDHEFEFVAQYWCSETGKFTGTTGWFTDSPAWDAFEAATGVTPKAFLRAFEELIEDEAADDDDEADDDDDEADED